MIVGAHSGQERIGCDRFGSSLCETSHDDTVVIGPRRLKDDVFQNRVIHIRQFEEFDIRGITKESLNHGNNSQDHNRAQGPS